MKRLTLILLLVLIQIPHLKSQEIEKDTVQVIEAVEEKQDSSLVLVGIGPYSKEVREFRIQEKIKRLRQSTFTPSILVSPNENSVDLLVSSELVMTVTEADANALGLSLNGATEYYLEALNSSLQAQVFAADQSLLVNIGIATAIVLLFFIGLRFYNRLFRVFYTKISKQKGKLIKGLKIKNYEYLSAVKVTNLLILVAKSFKIALLLIIVYLLLPLLFSLFPWTQGIAKELFGYVIDPLKDIGLSFLGFIPDLLTILVIIGVGYYLLKILKFFQFEIARERLVIPGFYPEWAKPTYNLVKTIVLALVFVAIWPLLPMSNSTVFKGVSTFFGLLIALGGAGAFSNIIAGLVITYMRSFKIGDRVKIGDVVGDVKQKTLLNTKIKTIKNDIVSIPNSQMINSHTINYTSANDEDGLMLFTTVTIGYDVPWRQVHELLIEAALKTEHVKKLPKPFVLQTSLDDFYVSYQLNARTREIHKMAVIYSELHKNIQDQFNEAGVEIMSPHYSSIRDGNHSTISSDKLPEDYKAPGFNILGSKK